MPPHEVVPVGRASVRDDLSIRDCEDDTKLAEMSEDGMSILLRNHQKKRNCALPVSSEFMRLQIEVMQLANQRDTIALLQAMLVKSVAA